MKSKNLHVAPPGFRAVLWAWAPAIAWAALIFVLSSMPGDAFPKVDTPNVDKLVHVGVYVALGALCFRAIVRTTPVAGARAVVLATLLGTLYGASDEFHQSFTPRRSPDWRDGVADAAGSLIGAGALAARAARSTRSNQTPRHPRRRA